MAKAATQIKALAELVVFMDEAVIEWEPTLTHEALTALDQRTSAPLPHVGWLQIDPKELRTPRRHPNVAKSNDLIGIERHGKDRLNVARLQCAITDRSHKFAPDTVSFWAGSSK